MLPGYEPRQGSKVLGRSWHYEGITIGKAALSEVQNH